MGASAFDVANEFRDVSNEFRDVDNGFRIGMVVGGGGGGGGGRGDANKLHHAEMSRHLLVGCWDGIYLFIFIIMSARLRRL